MHCLQGSGSSSPGKHTKPNPTGMLVLSLVHQKGREEGGQLPASHSPLGTTRSAAQDCAAPCGSSAPRGFGCAALPSGAAGRARSSEGTKQLERKCIFMQPGHRTHTAEVQESSRSQTRAAVRRKTCKTKKAHKLQQKIRRAFTFFPQAVLKEANHGKGFFFPLVR